MKRYIDDFGLGFVIPVSALNLGARDDYLEGGFRTCSDARFSAPVIPTESRRRVPSPDRVANRWPLSSSAKSTNRFHKLSDDQLETAFEDDEQFQKEFNTGPFVNPVVDLHVASSHFYSSGGNVVKLPESVLITRPSKLSLLDFNSLHLFLEQACGDSHLLSDVMEVGVWESLVRNGTTGSSVLDRRDFGKSLMFLGSPAFLDEKNGAGILVNHFTFVLDLNFFQKQLVRDPDFCGDDYVSTRLRELLRPLVKLSNGFDPRSPDFRWDAVRVHEQNDCLHWGYPWYEGRGSNPAEFPSFW